MRKGLRISVRLVLVLTLAWAAVLSKVDWAEVTWAQQPSRTDPAIQILPVQGNIYLLAGAGANITVSTGFDGTLLVDAGRADMAEKVLATLQQLAATVQLPYFPPAPCVGPRCPGGAGAGAYSETGWSSQAVLGTVHSPGFLKPLRYIINTSLDPDHTSGNARIMAAGVTYTGANVARGVGGEGVGAEVWAHEAVLNRMVEANAPAEMQPRWTYYTPKYKWNGFFNGEGIELIHIPAAHTDGDTIVYFRYSDVISAGDVFAIDRYPRIDIERGGTLQGTIDGLNKILDIAIAQNKSQGGTYIIPGHGRICDTGDVVNYRNMVVKIHDRIQDLIQSGMTLQQVKAARPTLDFDGQYGSPDAFIEAAYRSLSEER
jgi:glyoxylase-like metal-dependent hydrolase (beta-lactamase superfamily II)